MRRRALLVIAIVPTLASCGEAPTGLAATVDGPRETPVVEAVGAFQRVRDLVSDVFVRELVERQDAWSLERGLDDISMAARGRDAVSTERALRRARLALAETTLTGTEEADHEAAILRDVLELVLSDAEWALRQTASETAGRERGDELTDPSEGGW